jgi:hypothetical protein
MCLSAPILLTIACPIEPAPITTIIFFFMSVDIYEVV